MIEFLAASILLLVLLYGYGMRLEALKRSAVRIPVEVETRRHRRKLN